MKKIFLIVLCLPVLIFLSSCGDSNKERRDAYIEIIERQISSLNSQLRSNSIKNASILKAYSMRLQSTKPDMAELARTLEQDASPDGPVIMRFKSQLEEIKAQIDVRDPLDINEDLKALSNATDAEIYGDSLIDSINVIADLSAGELPRVSAPAAVDEKESRPGSQLVGNSRYGYWQSRNGQSVWVWLAAYSMFNRPYYSPYYYHSWSYHRPWSYHNDYGRNLYSTRSERTANNKVASANKANVKQYGHKTGKKISSYSKTNSKFKPSRSSQRASRSSRYSSSHRSSSRSSRGGYGGK